MSNVKHDKKYWEQYGQNFNAEWSSPFEPESVVQNFLKVLDTPAVTQKLAEQGLQVDRETLKEFIKDRQAEWYSQGDGYSPSPDTNSLPTNPVVCNYDSPVVTNLKREPHPHPGVPTPPYGRASTSLEVIANKVRVLEDKLEDAKKDVLYHKQLLSEAEVVNWTLNDRFEYLQLKADAYRMVWSAREYLQINYPDTDWQSKNILSEAFQELSESGISHGVIRDKYVAEKKSRQKAISFCCQKPLKEEIIDSILFLACSACGRLWLCKGPVEGTKAATPEQFHPGALVSFYCPKPLSEKLIDNILYFAESFGVELRVRKGPVEGTASDVQR